MGALAQAQYTQFLPPCQPQKHTFSQKKYTFPPTSPQKHTTAHHTHHLPPTPAIRSLVSASVPSVYSVDISGTKIPPGVRGAYDQRSEGATPPIFGQNSFIEADKYLPVARPNPYPTPHRPPRQAKKIPNFSKQSFISLFSIRNLCHSPNKLNNMRKGVLEYSSHKKNGHRTGRSVR